MALASVTRCRETFITTKCTAADGTTIAWKNGWTPVDWGVIYRCPAVFTKSDGVSSLRRTSALPARRPSDSSLLFHSVDQPSNALHLVPLAGALYVFDQRGGDVVLPLLIGMGEAAHFGLAVIAVGSGGGLGQRIVRLVVIGERGEWHGESHVLGQDLLGLVVGDHPLDEVERGLLVLFGGVLVLSPNTRTEILHGKEERRRQS